MVKLEVGEEPRCAEEILYGNSQGFQVRPDFLKTCSGGAARSAKGGRGQKQCRFLLKFRYTSDLVASKSLDDWFEDDGIDVMCLVHRLNISQLHGQGRLSTVA